MSQVNTNEVGALRDAMANPYAHLRAALAGMEQVGQGEHLLRAIQGYVTLGMGDVAAELMERLTEWSPDPALLVDAQTVVQAARSGRLSWSRPAHSAR